MTYELVYQWHTALEPYIIIYVCLFHYVLCDVCRIAWSSVIQLGKIILLYYLPEGITYMYYLSFTYFIWLKITNEESITVKHDKQQLQGLGSPSWEVLLLL